MKPFCILAQLRPVLAAAVLLTSLPCSASSLILETPRLIVSDRAALSDDRLGWVATHAQETLEKVAAFWQADAVLEQIGKIRVIVDPPLGRDVYSSVLVPLRGTQTRTVRVFGAGRTPQMLAHKLTTALFPHRDKLVRNMMGIPTEERLGNPLAFPGCGFRSDEWALALKEMHALIPLADFTPEESSWGHAVSSAGMPRVEDRMRQTIGYVESGSFGAYLLRTFGVDKVKAFYQDSLRGGRPWRAVFGADLPRLEADWLAALEAMRAERAGNIALLVELLKRDPAKACADLQLRISKTAAADHRAP